MESAEAALARLCDPGAEVSAHWLIGAGGEVWALVPEARRAWHAGAGAWGGITDVNSASIGIELANPGDRPFPEPQTGALERLLDAIMMRWKIPAEGVIGHSDLAPGRKVDPGPRFDWRRLAASGRAVWPAGVDAGRDAWSGCAGGDAGRDGAPGPRSGPGSAGAAAPAPGGAAPPPADPARFHRAARRFGYRCAPGREEALLAAFRLRFRPRGSGAPGHADVALIEALARRWPGPGAD